VKIHSRPSSVVDGRLPWHLHSSRLMSCLSPAGALSARKQRTHSSRSSSSSSSRSRDVPALLSPRRARPTVLFSFFSDVCIPIPPCHRLPAPCTGSPLYLLWMSSLFPNCILQATNACFQIPSRILSFSIFCRAASGHVRCLTLPFQSYVYYRHLSLHCVRRVPVHDYTRYDVQ